MYNAHIKAGKICSQARQETFAKIKVGANVRELLDWCDERIKELGGGIAFPPQISLNNTAAHFCPTQDDDVLIKEGDLVKLDVGVHINGFIADSAMSIHVGEKSSDLTKATKNMLGAALKIAQPGTTLGEIGEAIQSEAEALDLRPIVNLSGHTLGQYVVHAGTSIPNYGTGDKTELEEDMTIAIEPFATDGQGMIHEAGNSTLFSFEKTKPIRSVYARKVTHAVKQFEGLPFTTRNLTKQFPKPVVNVALKDMVQAGILHSYPPLLEIGRGTVSQHEHSVIVRDKPIVFTRTTENY